MSWGFKAADELLKSSADFWVTQDAQSPSGFRPRDISDDHTMAERLVLDVKVPQTVRDYFDATRMLWVYGSLYYPFYSMAAVHAGLCIELALRERFRIGGIALPRRVQNLAGMLHEAKNRGWLMPERFSAIRLRRAQHAFMTEGISNATGTKTELAEIDESPAGQATALNELIEHARQLRNMHAHPEFLALLLPNWAYGHLVLTRELVEQLFVDVDEQST